MIYQITIATYAGRAILVVKAKTEREAIKLTTIILKELKTGRIKIERIRGVPEKHEKKPTN